METTNTQKTILIVEDELNLLDVLRDEFVAAGFKVIKAANGEEGLNAVMTEHPDIMLVDILMPKMDGIAMLKKIRAIENGKKIPAIILTNLNDSETITHALEQGAYDFLVKSDWVPKALVKRVKEKLGMTVS